MSLAFYETMARLLREGQTLAVATIVARQGSVPRCSGAKMVVTASGETAFTIGGGAFEALVIGDALEAIRQGHGFEKEYRFTEEGENALGMVCGGTARVLFEVVRAPCRLFIFGGGHVGREVARLSGPLGFDVTVIDDRADYLDPARYPEGTRMVRAGRDFSSDLPPIPAGAYVAILTRCHKTDLAAVRHAVGRGAAYVGLIGSRRKIATVLARAAEVGTPREAVAEVHGPIGLPIGAESPEEIAVSIAAEMIQARSAGAASHARALVTPFARKHSRSRPVSSARPA
ncbi:MAG TPA: XdhC/CoxI family protein [Candidatus Polarisedimenticolia bacterium]|nr:XdhC/CoxI family protein [Candidatus Polarisedimenticolia bacterium]